MYINLLDIRFMKNATSLHIFQIALFWQKVHDRCVISILWYIDFTSQRYPIVINGGNSIYNSHSYPGFGLDK